MFFSVPHSSTYDRLIDLLSPYANDSTVNGLARLTGDGHVVLKRLAAELPVGILDWFSCKDLRPQFVQLFASVPGNCGIIHKDGIDRKATLNIPIRGCAKGATEWFQGQEFSERKIANPTTTVRITEEEIAVYPERLDRLVSHSMVLTCPHVLDIDEWHRLNNTDNPEYRYVMAVRFHNNPTAQHLYERLS